MKLLFSRILKSVFLAAFSLFVIQCAVQKVNNPAPPLPIDVRGVRVGENRDDAEKRLKDIGKLIRLEEKKQEVWVLKDDKNYSHLAVGYDRENRIRYVTAFARPQDGTPVKFADIGDPAAAEKQESAGNYRYTWQAAGDEQQPAYTIIVQGSQPERLAMFTLSASPGKNSADEDEEAEREEREEKK